MKVTSQVRSPTCVTPTFCPAKHVTEVDLAPVKADAAAMGHRKRRVVKRVHKVLEAAIDTRGARVEVRRHFHGQDLIRPLLVVTGEEGIKAPLLLEDIRGSGFGRFQLQRPMHALVPAVSLGMSRLNP
jgi:hypothetical protein